jgi:hypothetical protein
MYRKRINLLFLALLISCAVTAQFRNKCNIDSIKESGFYSIPISPQISEYIKTDLSDIRIADQSAQWVPHILNWPNAQVSTAVVKSEMPIVNKETINAQTIVIIKNVPLATLSNFSVRVKNTSANRFASIGGSDDKLTWFTITDSLLLKDPLVYPDGSFFHILFPPVKYQYFRINIFNGKNDPLNVQTVITEREDLSEQVEKFIPNPINNFTQTDSSHYSFIKIENKDHFHVSRLRVLVASPKYFDRQVAFYTSYPGSIQQLLQTAPEKEFILSTNSSLEYDVPCNKSTFLVLLIKNRDNPPLKLRSIITMQERKQLIAYLEKGKRYQLLFNDSLSGFPDYDLQRFKDTIPGAISILNTGKIETLSGQNATSAIKKDNKWWIWPTIIVVVLLLGYFTITLARDMNKQSAG